jgi:hypothetical protein
LSQCSEKHKTAGLVTQEHIQSHNFISQALYVEMQYSQVILVFVSIITKFIGSRMLQVCHKKSCFMSLEDFLDLVDLRIFGSFCNMLFTLAMGFFSVTCYQSRYIVLLTFSSMTSMTTFASVSPHLGMETDIVSKTFVF